MSCKAKKKTSSTFNVTSLIWNFHIRISILVLQNTSGLASGCQQLCKRFFFGTPPRLVTALADFTPLKRSLHPPSCGQIRSLIEELKSTNGLLYLYTSYFKKWQVLIHYWTFRLKSFCMMVLWLLWWDFSTILSMVLIECFYIRYCSFLFIC